jgi:hypothetical protein
MKKLKLFLATMIAFLTNVFLGKGEPIRGYQGLKANLSCLMVTPTLPRIPA